MLVLTVAMVVALEQVARDAECEADAVIAGQKLFCLYARARWSDAQRVERLMLDGDPSGEDFYVQAEARDVKTASVTAHKNVFLPM
eukprot:1056120-Amphidinium_carterae.1